MDNRMEQLEKEVQELRNILMSFTNASQLDPQIASTIRTVVPTDSSKTAASATQAVNEAGAGSYNVMTAPSGFLQIGSFNVPYIN